MDSNKETNEKLEEKADWDKMVQGSLLEEEEEQ